MTAATVTVQVASKLPSSVFTVMVAVPVDSGVTAPFTTVAIEVSLDDQVTFLLVALAGATVATRVPVAPPAVRSRVALSKVTPVTGTADSTTVKVAVVVAVLPAVSVAV